METSGRSNTLAAVQRSVENLAPGKPVAMTLSHNTCLPTKMPALLGEETTLILCKSTQPAQYCYIRSSIYICSLDKMYRSISDINKTQWRGITNSHISLDAMTHG